MPLLVMAGLVGGCAAGDATDPDAAPGLRQSMLQSEPSRAARRLTSTGNGLQLRKWLVADDPDRIAEALGRHGASELPEPVAEQLRRNGLRFVRVPRADVETLLVELGGATVNVEGWQGQIVQWRSVHDLPVPAGGAPLAIDGHVRRFGGGRLGLLARGWTIQLEDGPAFTLQLIPAHMETRTGTDIRQLLGAPNAAFTETFRSMAIEGELRRDSVYVLTCAAPQERWGTGRDVAPAADPPEIAGIGPAVVPPRTLGEFLLSTPGPGGSRGVLLLVPMIPDELYPPELLEAAGDGETP